MSFPIWIVDAFVGQLENRVLRGNPAAVVILEDADKWSQAPWLQEVAAEFNLSETAFVRHRENNAWDLRWFTPCAEVDLCGHATLASSHVLCQSGRAQGDELEFHTRSGVLGARRVGEQITIELPVQSVKMSAPPPALVEAVGLRAGADPVVAYRAADDWLLKIASGRLETLQPNFAWLRELAGPLQMRGVIVTARAPRGAAYDFSSRFFAAGVGIDEDPVTGSAHTKLAPLWSGLLHKDELTAVQLSPRGGCLRLKLRGERVELTGETKIRIQGQWL